jgi:hypothetical protein
VHLRLPSVISGSHAQASQGARCSCFPCVHCMQGQQQQQQQAATSSTGRQMLPIRACCITGPPVALALLRVRRVPSACTLLWCSVQPLQWQQTVSAAEQHAMHLCSLALRARGILLRGTCTLRSKLFDCRAWAEQSSTARTRAFAAATWLPLVTIMTITRCAAAADGWVRVQSWQGLPGRMELVTNAKSRLRARAASGPMPFDKTCNYRSAVCFRWPWLQICGSGAYAVDGDADHTNDGLGIIDSPAGDWNRRTCGVLSRGCPA